jgi:hypothetical protein
VQGWLAGHTKADPASILQEEGRERPHRVKPRQSTDLKIHAIKGFEPGGWKDKVIVVRVLIMGRHVQFRSKENRRENGRMR